MLSYRFNFFHNESNSFLLVFLQLKAKTEMLLSAEAAKAAQKANLENNLETAQHALQDKQQVSASFEAKTQRSVPCNVPHFFPLKMSLPDLHILFSSLYPSHPLPPSCIGTE